MQLFIHGIAPPVQSINEPEISEFGLSNIHFICIEASSMKLIFLLTFYQS